jgi:hypothetical protein
MKCLKLLNFYYFFIKCKIYDQFSSQLNMIDCNNYFILIFLEINSNLKLLIKIVFSLMSHLPIELRTFGLKI